MLKTQTHTHIFSVSEARKAQVLILSPENVHLCLETHLTWLQLENMLDIYKNLYNKKFEVVSQNLRKFSLIND